MTTSETAPPPCSPPWNCFKAKWWDECYQRHRHQEFMKFLRRLDAEFPAPVPLHLVIDNYGTHKKPEVRSWLKKHPRFVLHFVPTSSSWLNLVERWFGQLSRRCIRRGPIFSVADLPLASGEFLEAWNENPKPLFGQPPWNQS